VALKTELLGDLRKVDEEYETGARRKAPAAPSLAVLYFDNLGESKEDDYFAAGMTEDIITDISKIDKIKVLSRADILPYRGKTVNIKEIGRKLNVDYMLEGSVRKAQKKLRINAQLIRVSDGFHVWAERFDRELEDVFEVQSDVSQKVAQALEIKLTKNQIERIEKKPTISIKAYDYYLRGRDYYWRLGKEDLEFAIQMYKKALEVDPQYALAYAGLADSYQVIPDYSSFPPKEAYPKAEAAAKKALEIESSLAEAYAPLAMMKSHYYWDWVGAESDFRRAIELNPNYATAHHWYALVLMSLARFDEAIKEIKRAQELDPLSLVINRNVGTVFLHARLYGQAIEHYRKTDRKSVV